MSLPTIMVTGANGQLGKELREAARMHRNYEFVFLSREELPIHSEEKVNEVFASIRPRYCLNCAAYTAVDKAESEKETAFLVNGTGTGMLASACKLHDAGFIHVSTDYVFNGDATIPYVEDAPVEPVNAYGESKLMGELLAQEHNPAAIIIRTSWVYSEYGNNFVKTMMRLMADRSSLNVVSDQLGSPTYAADLADTMLHIIKSGKWTPGVYHYSNDGVISWFTFAEAIRDAIGSSCVIHPIPTSSFPTPAKRPGFSVLDKTRIKETYDILPPDWRESLNRCIERLSVK